MAMWLVPLHGDKFDLEEFPRWFPSGEIYVIEQDSEYFLVGPTFERFSEAEAVLNEANNVLERFTAAINLLGTKIRKPVIDTVIRKNSDGKRNVFVFLSGSLTTRSKLSATLTLTSDSSNALAQETQAQGIISKATGNLHLEQALSIWNAPTRSWPQLYRTLEEIEMYLGQQVDTAGLCTGKERTRFVRTANTAEVSGMNARHAIGKFLPPTNPMSLKDAADFIRRLLLGVLYEKSE